MLPSTGLIKSVLVEELSQRYVSIKDKPYMDRNDLVYGFRSGCGAEGANQKMNISEFLDRSMEWLFDNSGCNSIETVIFKKSKNRKVYRIDINFANSVEFFSGGTRLESVLKACEWLRKDV